MDWIPDWTSDVLCVIGIVCCVSILLVALVFMGMATKDLIQECRYKNRYKHRFDKPPTAECYCKDCKWHIDKGSAKNKCTNVTWADRYTPDNGFCHEAEPKARDDNADD